MVIICKCKPSSGLQVLYFKAIYLWIRKDCIEFLQYRRIPNKKVKQSITGLDRPLVFKEVEAPRFQDSRHMKVVRLSALRTGRLYTPEDIAGTHFC
jgi:hypothetical protein